MDKKFPVDFSYGIIPLKKEKDTYEVFLIQHKEGGGHWGFPKGHKEALETPIEAAKRELFEETHLTVDTLLSLEPYKENYQFTHKGKVIHKEVWYFPALVSGVPELQQEEIKAAGWFPIDKGIAKMTYPEGKRICEMVRTSLK